MFPLSTQIYNDISNQLDNYSYSIIFGTFSDTNSVELPAELTDYNETSSNLINNTSTELRLSVSVTDAILIAVSFTLIMLFTLIGNVMVIIAIFSYRPLKNVQNMFLVSLACADITLAVCVMPYSILDEIINQWILGTIMCEIWLTCDVLLCTASILNLCAIALDRYWAIYDPINYAQHRTMRKVLQKIGLVWLISALISIPPLIGWNDWPSTFTAEQPCQLSSRQGYIIYSSLGSFYVPLIIMATVYYKIFEATKKRLRDRAIASAANQMSLSVPVGIDECSHDNCADNHAMSSSAIDTSPEKQRQNGSVECKKTAPVPTTAIRKIWEEKQRISLSKERRAARILGVVMGVFVFCWLPFFIMYVVMPFCPVCTISPTTRFVITWLGYINSALNPVIYTIFNVDFRKAFMSQLKCFF